MKILVINGPNLNLLGLREPAIYGNKSYDTLCTELKEYCDSNKCKIEIYQSNHEGMIIDKIQSAYMNFDAIIINAAGYTHTSIAILDALKAVSIRTIEVHLSDINNREEYRKKSYISEIAEKTFCGKGFESYIEAIDYLIGN